MPPAVVAAGVIAAGTIGGAVLSSHSQTQAANQAQQAQQQATDAQLQLGEQSLAQQNALAQQSLGLNQAIYNSNYDVLSPYASRGNVAGDQINALLGLPKAPVMKSPLETTTGGLAPIQLPPPPAGTTTPASSTPAPTGYTGPSLSQIYAMQHDGVPGNFQPALDAYNTYYAAHLAAPTSAPTNALAPQTVEQHAQAAIAAGADPAAVQARMAQLNGRL